MNIEILLIHFLWITKSVVMGSLDGNSIRSDETETIPYQSFCDPSKNNGECSENFHCRCASIIPTGERICSLQVQCRFALPCDENNKCRKPGTICVRDHRCDNRQLCYPVSLTSPDTCPPLATIDTINNIDGFH